MAANKELFDLVKSLTSPEKRYLKKLMKAMAGNKQKKYHDHFDKVVSMKKYDDLLWKRKMGLKATSKQIKETNNYLYDFILKGLIMYTGAADKSKNKVLVESQKIHILQQKGLYETTMRKINELIDLSVEQQYFDLCLHLLNEKRSVSFGLGIMTTDHQAVNKLYDDFDVYLENARNINAYLRLLNATSRLLEENETVRTPEVEQRFIDVLEHEMLSSSDKAICLRSKNLFFIIKLAFLITILREDEAITLSDESIDYFTNDKQKIDNPMYLGFMLNKRLEICAIFERWDEFSVWLKKFTAMRSGLNFYQAKKYWFINGLRHRLRYLYACGDIQAFHKLMKTVDAEFYETCRTDYASAFFEAEFSLIKLYHLAGDYHEALNKVESILGSKAIVRKELLLATRVLYLIIHYDLENIFYLPYAVQSLYRSLLQSSKGYQAEARLITFLKKLPKMVDEKDLKKAKRILLKEWSEMKNDRFQKDFFYYFPYTEWISAKIEERPFREHYVQTAHVPS
jgi:hypothetical protein